MGTKGRKMNKKYKIIKVPNGDIMIDFYIYTCNRCGADIPENYGLYSDPDRYLCWDCAFKEGLISGEKYIEMIGGFGDDMVKAGVHDDKIVIVFKNSKFPWEKTNKDYRKSKEYQEWRTRVFERDKYTCAICGKVGGSLEAHHIKPFAKYEDVRFDVDNGVTLCKECHKKVHREKINEWLHT